MARMVETQVDYLVQEHTAEDLVNMYTEAENKAYLQSRLALRYKQALIQKCKQEGTKVSLPETDQYTLRTGVFPRVIQYVRKVWSDTRYQLALEEYDLELIKMNDKPHRELLSSILKKHTRRVNRSFLTIK